MEFSIYQLSLFSLYTGMAVLALVGLGCFVGRVLERCADWQNTRQERREMLERSSQTGWPTGISRSQIRQAYRMDDHRQRFHE